MTNKITRKVTVRKRKTYSAKEAMAQLHHMDRSKFYRLVNNGTIKAIPKPGSKQSVYDRASVDALAQELAQFRAAIEDAAEEEALTFVQATPEDMDGVYAVAHELFGYTSSAEIRKPMVEVCPRGNYLVKQNEEIVAFIIIQALKPERLVAFMRGEIRGWDLTAQDLLCFEPGGSYECLVKSIGATRKYGKNEQLRFSRRLLRGAVQEIIRMGREGIRIEKLYATSPYPEGQKICESAEMQEFSQPLGDRRTYVVDISAAHGKPYAIYKAEIEKWIQYHDQ